MVFFNCVVYFFFLQIKWAIQLILIAYWYIYKYLILVVDCFVYKLFLKTSIFIKFYEKFKRVITYFLIDILFIIVPKRYTRLRTRIIRMFTIEYWWEVFISILTVIDRFADNQLWKLVGFGRWLYLKQDKYGYYSRQYYYKFKRAYYGFRRSRRDFKRKLKIKIKCKLKYWFWRILFILRKYFFNLRLWEWFWFNSFAYFKWWVILSFSDRIYKLSIKFVIIKYKYKFWKLTRYLSKKNNKSSRVPKVLLMNFFSFNKFFSQVIHWYLSISKSKVIFWLGVIGIKLDFRFGYYIIKKLILLIKKQDNKNYFCFLRKRRKNKVN